MATSEWKRQRLAQHSLYPGQREALTRRLEGADNAAIADAMGITKQAVVAYLGGAKVFYGAESIDAAARQAEAEGLVPFYREG
jgi:predicted transcriptional regulator